MTNSFGLPICKDKLKAYREKDLDYEVQARNLLVNGLGYTPPLYISVLSELNIRSALRRHDLGETTRKDLNDYIEFQVRFVNKVMLDSDHCHPC
ncbi:hypothetical protein GCM10011531_06980 [Aquaticitalea lipolytica]|uniref:Uncharacterized protein n=1 Tax=Aquaticitalea lipolytica TaxID=1247562 RepID=A0A8J2TPG5_9FLAO|nr:hypothetical protein GCM10011531_06980 [Aquaticitalea lipolytica]